MKKFKLISIIFYLIIFVFLDFLITNIFTLGKNILLDDARINNNLYHHDLKKNFESYGVLNEKVFTNSLGFRDFYKRKVEINSEMQRILLMGDSFTYGLGLEYKDSFAGLITKEYEKKNIEILNAASVSYSPTIYFKKIEYLINEVGLKFNEIFLFIDVSDVYDDLYRYEINNNGQVVNNSNFEKNIKKTNFIEKSKNYISSNFTIIFLILNSINDYFSPDLISKEKFAIFHRNARWNWDTDFKYEAVKGLKINNIYLDKMKALLDKNNIKLKVIIYPWPSDIFFRNKKTDYEFNWEGWSKKNNVKFYNFVKYFDYVKNFSDKKKQKIINELYQKNDMHFNKEGSLLFFNQIINFLKL